jgi:hypothetical protein
VTFNTTTTAVIPNLAVNGGILAGTGNILVPATFSWTGGRIEGSGAIQLNTASTGSIGGAGLELSERTIVNEGTIFLNGQGPTLSNSAVIQNLTAGTIDIVGDYSIRGSGQLTNQGTLLKSAGDVGQSQIELDVINSGTIDVQVGNIAFVLGDFTHSDGAILQGNGTVDLSVAGAVTFDGDVNPGTSPGVLRFVGNALPSALSTANIEIGGLVVGTEHDQVNVTGNFVADGAANISVINGFTPQLGQTFTVLTYASRTGEFADTTGLSINPSLEFQLNWNATSLDLEVVAASPPTPSDIVFFSDSGGGLDLGVFASASDGSAIAEVVGTGTPLQYLIAPRWSMDRQRIAFTNDTSGTSALYMTNSDGTELTELVDNINSGYPRWSHNGQHLGFVCRSAVAAIDNICVIPNVDGAISSIPINSYTVATSNMPTGWETGPPAAAWDPRINNQDRFFFARDSIGNLTVSRLYSRSFDGTGIFTITTDLIEVVAGQPLRVLELDVSSDGSMIVFVGRNPATSEERLYVINTDGTGLRQLTFPTGFAVDELPKFSPDGTEVLFGRRDDFCELTYWIVDINNTDGSLERSLSGDSMTCEMDQYDQIGMDWSPDGSQIVLVGQDDIYSYMWRLYVVPSDVTPATYQSVRVRVGRDVDAASTIFEGQPNWRP